MHKCMHKGASMRDNRTKQIMRAGGLALGVSMTIADPFVAEVIGAAGFDFVLIDTEHAPGPPVSREAGRPTSRMPTMRWRRWS